MIFRKRLSPTARANRWLDWMDEGVGEQLIQEIKRYPKTVTDSGIPLLHVAILANRYEVAEALLQQGANPNLKDQYGQPPILLAAERNSASPFIDLLISNGAQVNVSDRHGASPLMYAARANNTEAVSVLLNASADPNHRDMEGDTVIMYAVFSANEALVLSLIKAGGDPSQTNFDGISALDKSPSGPMRMIFEKP